ncbi:hypothetical protein V1478_005608 [Vespula squamosa]|uniref:Uncharacterized protein n=1 Tax=Vespula squamosa TaxID=30214 RepID=A0ABD2BAJ7_VESSQ
MPMATKVVNLAFRRRTTCRNELPLTKNNESLFPLSNARISSGKKRHSTLPVLYYIEDSNCVIIATEINDSTHLVLLKLGPLTSEVNAKMYTSNDK